MQAGASLPVHRHAGDNDSWLAAVQEQLKTCHASPSCTSTVHYREAEMQAEMRSCGEIAPRVNSTLLALVI
jgi:hypothetical protein